MDRQAVAREARELLGAVGDLVDVLAGTGVPVPPPDAPPKPPPPTPEELEPEPVLPVVPEPLDMTGVTPFRISGGAAYGNGPRTVGGPAQTGYGQTIAVAAMSRTGVNPGRNVTPKGWKVHAGKTADVGTQLNVFVADPGATGKVGAEKHMQSAMAFAAVEGVVTVSAMKSGKSKTAQAVAPAGVGPCMIVVGIGGDTASTLPIGGEWTRLGRTGPGWVSAFAAWVGALDAGVTVDVPLTISDEWSARIVRVAPDPDALEGLRKPAKPVAEGPPVTTQPVMDATEWEGPTGRYNPTGEYLHQAQGMSTYKSATEPDFWVDPERGDDNNDGRSEPKALRSKARAKQLAAGRGARIGYLSGKLGQVNLHGGEHGTAWDNMNIHYVLPGHRTEYKDNFSWPAVWLKQAMYVGMCGFYFENEGNTPDKHDWLMGIHSDGYEQDGLSHHHLIVGNVSKKWGQCLGGQGTRYVLNDGNHTEDGAWFHNGGGSNTSYTRHGVRPQNGDTTPVALIDVPGYGRVAFDMLIRRNTGDRARQKVPSDAIGLAYPSDGQIWILGDLEGHDPETVIGFFGNVNSEWVGGKVCNSFEAGTLIFMAHNEGVNAGRHNEFVHTAGDPLHGMKESGQATFCAQHYDGQKHPANQKAVVWSNKSKLGNYPRAAHFAGWGKIKTDVKGNSWQEGDADPIPYALTDLHGRPLSTEPRQGI